MVSKGGVGEGVDEADVRKMMGKLGKWTTSGLMY